MAPTLSKSKDQDDLRKTYEIIFRLFWILVGLVLIGVATYRLWGINGFLLACGMLIIMDEALIRLSGYYDTNSN